MTKQQLEETIRTEYRLKFSKNNRGKITLYLNENIETLIDAYADYKSQRLVAEKCSILSFQQFIMALSLRNIEAVEELIYER